MAKKVNVNNLDTLDTRAKKKKNFIVIAILVVVVTILFISIGSAFLKVDKQKVYQERKDLEASQDLKIIQQPEFKENWAISIENRMESQEKKTQEVISELSGKQDRVLDELKDIIRESSQKQADELTELSEVFDSKINSLKNDLLDQIEIQNDKIEQVAVMAQNNSKAVARNEADIMIGSDLLPDNKNTGNGQNNLTIIVSEGERSTTVNSEIEKTLSPEELAKLEAARKAEQEDKDLENAANSALEGIPTTEEVAEIKKEDPVTENKNKRKNIKLVDIDTSFNASIISAQAEIEETAKAKTEGDKTPTAYHLSTGLSQAYMITGAYAPAFQEGESEPLPVLLEAEGQIIQPNDHLASVDKCFLLGSAKGNMNSQTANIKLVSISCILNEGEYRIEGALSGWVIGENGIPGIHGELIHKNGAWLARTFVSGFLETFANAIGGGTTSTINLGTDTGNTNSTTTTSTGTAISDNLATAGAQGISTVFNKLGDYYLKMAEQIFPVIEVRGGRTVDILLIGGEDLSIVENNKMDLANINDHLSSLRLKKEAEEDTMSETNAFTKSILNSNGGSSENEPAIPEPVNQ